MMMLAVARGASQPAPQAWVEWLNVSVLAAGGVAALAWGVALVRSGRWRQPLAGTTGHVGLPLPYLLLALLVVATHTFVSAALLAILPGSGTPEQRRTPGAAAWHVAYTADSAGKLAGCAVIILLLHRFPAFARAAGRPGRTAAAAAARTVGVGLWAALVIMSVTSLQLAMGQALWRWLRPDIAPPVHPVLQGIHQSAWGTLGVVQLWVAAVVVAPIAEELFFRGLVLEGIYRFAGRAWVAVAASAAAFGAVHQTQPQDVLPLATMGLILGYVRVRHGSIEACIVAHALFNARTLAFLLLSPARG